eukprot:6774335-Pyramimonas_sp.AAC.1
MLSAALATGRWRDTESIHGAEPTCGLDPKWDMRSPGARVSRPDLIVADAAARGAIHSSRLRRDL